MIRRRRDPHATANRSTHGCVPRNVNIIAQRTAWVGVGSDHRLVVEVVLTTLKRKESYRGIRLAAISRSRHRHFSPVDADTVRRAYAAKEHHNVAVEDIALRIESQRGIRAKVKSAGALRRRQRQIYAAPPAAVVRREVSPHRQAKNL